MDNWHKIENNEYYLGVVLGTIRSLFTYIKSKLPVNSTNKELHRPFQPKEFVKAERFDKLIEHVSQEIKKKYLAKKKKLILQHRSKPQTQSTPSHRVVLNQCVIDYMTNPKAPGIKFNKGNGHITTQFALRELGKTSLYQDSFQGKQTGGIQKSFANYFKTSVAGGACMPDPCEVNGVSKKLRTLSQGMSETNEKLRKTIEHFRSITENAGLMSNRKQLAGNRTFYGGQNDFNGSVQL